MKEKYRDQDEEDRELIMKLLGVRGQLCLPQGEVAPAPSPDHLCHHSLQAPTGRTKGKKGRRARQKKR